MLLPLKDSNYTSRIGLDPNKLLSSNTLGVSPRGKTLSITYRHGGGNSHNVGTNDINSVDNPIITFPYETNSNSLTDDKKEEILFSISVINEEEAIGGTPGLTLNELKSQIPNAMKSQSRIITHQDLIARIYSMPSDFGRVNKIAAIESRGFVFASAVSYILKKPFIMLRKKNKLPAEVHSVDFELEYGTATIEVHKDSLNENDSVLIIDDLIATGGTAEAAAKLVEISDAKVASFVFVINLFDLGGSDNLIKNNYQVENLIDFPGH